jgi:hypothetical protein
MQIWKYIFGVIVVAFFTSAQAQDFAFSAKASKTQMGLNQRVKVEYSVNKNGADDFTPPSFDGFKVIAGPSTSVSQSWVNGKSTFSQSYIYFLQPITKGEFTIPPATITYKGEAFQSETVKIIVVDAIEEPKNPNDPEAKAQENIFLIAHVSNAQPYVGESIYVEYRLYFTNQIEFSNAQFGEQPEYAGFWNQEIPITHYDKEVGQYQGKQYNYYVLKKTVLIPQKTGKLIVEPIDMDVLVGVPTGKYDFFGYPLIQRFQQHYTSGSRLVQVKALPETGKPVDFTGAVGDYSLKVTANKNSINTNESSRIDVSISGIGNLKLFELPKLTVPAELEVYPPERKEHLNTTSQGIKGKISDTYNIVANYNGKYIIPRVSFSYFNPKDKQYHTLSGEKIVMNVMGENTPVENLNDITTNSTTKQQVLQSGNALRYISDNTVFKPTKKSDFYGSGLFYSLLGFSFLAIPLFILAGNKYKERQADVVGNQKREADRLSKKYLSEARKNLGDKDAFYESLERALHNFLKAKLQITTSDMSQEKIAQLLREKSVSESTISEFNTVLNDCNYARYTPLVKGIIEQELDKAAKVLQQINTEISA